MIVVQLCGAGGASVGLVQRFSALWSMGAAQQCCSAFALNALNL